LIRRTLCLLNFAQVGSSRDGQRKVQHDLQTRSNFVGSNYDESSRFLGAARALTRGKVDAEVRGVAARSVAFEHREPRRAFQGPWRRLRGISSGVIFGCTLCLALIAAASQTQAAPVTFTLTGPNIQGTLNGVAFDAPFTITALADPAAMVFGTVDYGGPIPHGALAATSTMIIDGFATFTFTDPLFGPFQTDLSVEDPGFLFGGFGLPNNGGLYAGFFAQGYPTGDSLIDQGLGVKQRFSFQTSGGTLIIDSDSGGPASYGPIVSSPVPEPSTFALGLIASIATITTCHRTRRRSA
jgi:hypothetical protein